MGSTRNNAQLGANKANLLAVEGRQVTNTGTVYTKEAALFTMKGDVLNKGTIHGGSLDMQGKALENEGELYGEKAAKFQHTAIFNQGTLYGTDTVIHGTTLRNNGKIYGLGNHSAITLTGDMTNTALINLGDAAISSQNLINDNTGRIYGDNLAIHTGLLSHVAGANAPVIATREDLTITADAINNKEHALIMGMGNVDIKAGTIQNNSATIEAGQNMKLNVQELHNTNEHFATEVKRGKEEDIIEVYGAGETTHYRVGDPNYVIDIESYFYRSQRPQGIDVYVYDDESDHLHTPAGDHENWYKRVYHRVVSQDVIRETDPGKIMAGGSMSLTGGTVVNDKSHIMAGDALQVQVGSSRNIDYIGTEYTDDEGQVTNYWRHHRHGTDSTGSRTVEYKPPQAVRNVQLHAYVQAGNTVVQGSGASTSASPYTSPNGYGSINQPVAAGNHFERHSGSGAIGNSHTQHYVTFHYNSIFSNAPVTATYFVETDPEFTDRKKFLSSDYFFRQMKWDPERISKRLGDGFYEQTLIRDQIMGITGKRFISGAVTNEEQYKMLMDNATDFAKRSGATFGVALTPEQQEQLKTAIVWMEEQRVMLPDGQIVTALVPQVYVPETMQITGTAVLSAQNIDVKATHDVLNQGTIVAGGVTKISAANVNNVGGKIQGADRERRTQYCGRSGHGFRCGGCTRQTQRKKRRRKFANRHERF